MSDSVLNGLIASIPPTLTALTAVIIALKGNRKIEEVHKTINSGLTVRIAEAKELGNLTGRSELTQENKIIEDKKNGN